MPDLILSAEQKTALTQKSIQNIEILQMGIQELENYINTLTLENPVITQDSPAPDSTEGSIILPVNTEDFSDELLECSRLIYQAEEKMEHMNSALEP